MDEAFEQQEQVDVVIVGAGPTGLTAAIRLAQLGISFALLDTAGAPTRFSKAALVHAATLELFAELGVGDALVAAGRSMRRITMVDRGRRLIAVETRESADPLCVRSRRPAEHDRGVTARSGWVRWVGSVRRLHRVTSVEATARGSVRATVESADRPSQVVIHARFVIGADGSHSIVRATIGLEFRGETYSAQFVLADVALANSSVPTTRPPSTSPRTA